ncbi:MAG TPA: response regulator [Thermodesulfobacteriota bacterium]|nr:response regulator [Thermodesulfobacteriota bacterium]
MNQTSLEEKKLLIVDDEAGIRRNLHFGLTQHGFTIDDAEDGLSALAQIESSYHKGKPYSYVITDMVLPDINGLKLLEVIKSKYPTLPVIIISGYGTEVTADEVTARHGDAYLAKPFLADDLADVLEKVAPPKADAPQPITEPELKTSVSAYALIKVKEGGDVLGVFNKLYFMDNVLYCDAVRNGFDIVLLLNAATPAELDHIVQTKIKTLADIDEVIYCPVAKPKLEAGIQDFINDYEKQKSLSPQGNKPKRVAASLSAYVLIEVDKARFNEIYPKLYFLDNVVCCDTTKGKYDLVLLIQSATFDEMQRLVREKIGSIDGIVRTRALPVMNLFEM